MRLRLVGNEGQMMRAVTTPRLCARVLIDAEEATCATVSPYGEQ